MSHLNCKWWKG